MVEENESEIDFARIKFPYSISMQKTKAVFEHISRELPGSIEYSLEAIGYLGWERFGEKWRNDQKSYLKGGNINNRDSMNSLSFSMITKRTPDSFIYYNGINFDTIHGYSREELLHTHTANPNDMEKVREIIERYFKER